MHTQIIQLSGKLAKQAVTSQRKPKQPVAAERKAFDIFSCQANENQICIDVLSHGSQNGSQECKGCTRMKP